MNTLQQTKSIMAHFQLQTLNNMLLPVFVPLLLHLDTSTGCKEAPAFSAEGRLGAVGGLLSFLVCSVSDTCCWETGGTERLLPLSWESSCFPAGSRGLSPSCLFFSGEKAFEEPLDSGLAEPWEVCLAGAVWTSSSEKRTFFSEPRGDEVCAFFWGSSLMSRTSSGALSGSGFALESWSFRSSLLSSVKASSSSRNSSSVASEA